MILAINVYEPYYIYSYIHTPVHILYNTFNCHPCNKSPSAIAVTIVAAIAVAIAVPRAAAIAGVRAYESVPLYAVPL